MSSRTGWGKLAVTHIQAPGTQSLAPPALTTSGSAPLTAAAAATVGLTPVRLSLSPNSSPLHFVITAEVIPAANGAAGAAAAASASGASAAVAAAPAVGGTAKVAGGKGAAAAAALPAAEVAQQLLTALRWAGASAVEWVDLRSGPSTSHAIQSRAQAGT